MHTHAFELILCGGRVPGGRPMDLGLADGMIKAIDAPGSLSGAQNADVLAFMLQANKFPNGQTELARDAMMLKSIKFETKKPGN